MDPQSEISETVLCLAIYKKANSYSYSYLLVDWILLDYSINDTVSQFMSKPKQLRIP